MAKISDMLLANEIEKTGEDLEPARKAVETYKKLIEEHTEVHGYYQANEIIGRIENPRSVIDRMTFCGPYYASDKVELDSSKPTEVCFDPETVKISHLKYFLRQEGLYVKTEILNRVLIYYICLQ